MSCLRCSHVAANSPATILLICVGAGVARVSAEPAATVPEGAERRGTRRVVTVTSPSFELLKAVTKHNKSSTAKSELEQQWTIRRNSNTATVPVAGLWAALCAAGGIHLVGGVDAVSTV